ncbi:hypothetical protein WG78_17225 [Amantichitinum ursilacus]|uniref:Uncharacterized protein n=1 Tax=Amantichitinum ursilacus TaxID=857265 RepID=A0A0N0GM09_9NEIS|nr:hypothetical protein WG78_17225 [Amantichitinum ursilacus]
MPWLSMLMPDVLTSIDPLPRVTLLLEPRSKMTALPEPDVEIVPELLIWLPLTTETALRLVELMLPVALLVSCVMPALR